MPIYFSGFYKDIQYVNFQFPEKIDEKHWYQSTQVLEEQNDLAYLYTILPDIFGHSELIIISPTPYFGTLFFLHLEFHLYLQFRNVVIRFCLENIHLSPLTSIGKVSFPDLMILSTAMNCFGQWDVRT